MITEVAIEAWAKLIKEHGHQVLSQLVTQARHKKQHFIPLLSKSITTSYCSRLIRHLHHLDAHTASATHIFFISWVFWATKVDTLRRHAFDCTRRSFWGLLFQCTIAFQTSLAEFTHQAINTMDLGLENYPLVPLAWNGICITKAHQSYVTQPSPNLYAYVRGNDIKLWMTRARDSLGTVCQIDLRT